MTTSGSNTNNSVNNCVLLLAVTVAMLLFLRVARGYCFQPPPRWCSKAVTMRHRRHSKAKSSPLNRLWTSSFASRRRGTGQQQQQQASQTSHHLLKLSLSSSSSLSPRTRHDDDGDESLPYRVYVAVGSNLGDRYNNIRKALSLLCRSNRSDEPDDDDDDLNKTRRRRSFTSNLMSI